MHGLESEYQGEVDFIYLDRTSEANQDIVKHYGVTYQPVFIFVAPDGTELQRWVMLDPDEVRATFDSYLAQTGN